MSECSPRTKGFVGLVEQDTVDGGPHQNSPARLLYDGDHVVGDLAGPTLGVPGAVPVVADQKAVHGEAGVLWNVSCRGQRRTDAQNQKTKK